MASSFQTQKPSNGQDYKTGVEISS